MAALGLHCCTWTFSCCDEPGAPLHSGARASHCSGFSCCRARALESGLSSDGTRASLLHSMWALPGPGIKPVSPALAWGFLTTRLPGKPCEAFRILLSRLLPPSAFLYSPLAFRSLGFDSSFMCLAPRLGPAWAWQAQKE